MNKKSIIITLLVLASAAFIVWRIIEGGKKKVGHAVVLRDRSDSTASDCDCTKDLAAFALKDINIEKGSTVTVTVTGDAETANEPEKMLSFEVPVNRQVLEGQNAMAAKRDKLLQEVKSQCEKMRPTTVSPIFIAVKRAVQHLQSLGCGTASSPCALYVQSDLEDSVEKAIKALIDNPQSKQPLPAKIDNRGIRIIFFAIAETVGEKKVDGKNRQLTKKHDPQRIDRIETVWRSLFTNPELIIFKPHCLGE